MGDQVITLQVSEELKKLLDFSLDVQLATKRLLELLKCSADGCYDEVIEELFLETFPSNIGDGFKEQLYYYSDLFISANSHYVWLMTHDILCQDDDTVALVADLIIFKIIPKG